MLKTVFSGLIVSAGYFGFVYNMQSPDGFSLAPSSTDVVWSTAEEASAACSAIAVDAREKRERFRNGSPRINDVATRTALLAAVRAALNVPDKMLKESPELRNLLLSGLAHATSYHDMLDATAAIVSRFSMRSEGVSEDPLESCVAVLAALPKALSGDEGLKDFLDKEAVHRGAKLADSARSDAQLLKVTDAGNTVQVSVLNDPANQRIVLIPRLLMGPSMFESTALGPLNANIHGARVAQGRAHQGTLQRFEAVWPQLQAVLDQVIGEKATVVVAGHSEGGKIAQLAASALAQNKRVQGVRLFTLGSGRVFDGNASEELQRNCNIVHLRVFHEQDWHAYWPYHWRGYCHWGTPVPVKLPRQMSDSYWEFAKRGFQDPLFHALDLYGESLTCPRFLQVSYPRISASGGKRYE